MLNATNRKNAAVLTLRLEHDLVSDRRRLTEVREPSLPLLPTIGVRVHF